VRHAVGQLADGSLSARLLPDCRRPRFGLTGTPIDRTMQNTHRDFGPIRNGEQERYLSYYGIKLVSGDCAMHLPECPVS
jgi:hypothetical protein